MKSMMNACTQTVLYGVSVILMRGLSFFMMPYVIYQLSPEEFGFLELLSTIAILFSVVISMGLEYALYRFVGDKQSKVDRLSVMSQIYSLCVILCFITLFLNPVLSQLGSAFLNKKGVESLLSIIFLALSFETLVSVPLAWLRMNDRCMSFCLSSLLWTGLRATLVALLLCEGFGLLSIFLSGLISTSTVAMLLYVLIRKDIKWRINTKAYRDYLRYGIPILGSGILAFFLNGYDRWILVSYIDATQIAYYALAAKFALLVSFSMQPYGMWYMPKRFDVLNSHNGLHRSYTLSMIGIHMVLWVALVVGLFSPIFICIFLPGGYQSSIPLIPFFVLWACFKEMCEYVNLGCLASKDTKAQLGINIFVTLVGVIGMSIMAPFWGVKGVLVGLCIAHSLRFIIFLVVSERYLPLNFPAYKISLLIIVFVCVILAQMMDVSTDLSEVLLRALLSMSIFALISIMLFFRDCQYLLQLLPEYRHRREA